jgi:hypothetical protein
MLRLEAVQDLVDGVHLGKVALFVFSAAKFNVHCDPSRADGA